MFAKNRVLGLLLIVLAATAFQNIEPIGTPADPNANITWPKTPNKWSMDPTTAQNAEKNSCKSTLTLKTSKPTQFANAG